MNYCVVPSSPPNPGVSECVLPDHDAVGMVVARSTPSSSQPAATPARAEPSTEPHMEPPHSTEVKADRFSSAPLFLA
jgi:hypothetical protein